MYGFGEDENFNQHDEDHVDFDLPEPDKPKAVSHDE